MATIPETNEYPAGIYQLEQTDPVLGGAPNEATGAGMDNIPHQQLAKRTNWLKTRVDTLLAQVVSATTAVAGIVQLNTATNSTSTTTAATPSAVKAVNDNAETRALKTTTISAGGLATGGGSLAGNSTITVPAATQAQAEAGTDNATAMTPLRVKQALTALVGSIASGAGFAASLTANGYLKLPSWLGGLMFQWGTGQTSAAGTASIIFPVTFPVGVLTVLAGDIASENAAIRSHVVSVLSGYTASGFSAFSVLHDGTVAANTFSWFAVGK